jgi:hypothetical protein
MGNKQIDFKYSKPIGVEPFPGESNIYRHPDSFEGLSVSPRKD